MAVFVWMLAMSIGKTLWMYKHKPASTDQRLPSSTVFHQWRTFYGIRSLQQTILDKILCITTNVCIIKSDPWDEGGPLDAHIKFKGIKVETECMWCDTHVVGSEVSDYWELWVSLAWLDGLDFWELDNRKTHTSIACAQGLFQLM